MVALLNVADNRVTSRLVATMLKVIHTDPVSARGERHAAVPPTGVRVVEIGRDELAAILEQFGVSNEIIGYLFVFMTIGVYADGTIEVNTRYQWDLGAGRFVETATKHSISSDGRWLVEVRVSETPPTSAICVSPDHKPWQPKCNATSELETVTSPASSRAWSRQRSSPTPRPRDSCPGPPTTPRSGRSDAARQRAVARRQHPGGPGRVRVAGGWLSRR